MSKLQVDDIVNKGDNGAPGFSKGAAPTGACNTVFSGSAVYMTSYHSQFGDTGNFFVFIR